MIVLDSGVAIALLDTNDPHHTAALAAISPMTRNDCVLPATALAESLVGPYRRGASAVAIADQALARLAKIEPVAGPIAHAAARFRARRLSLKLPDALVLATAEELDAELLTTDDRLRRASRRVRVI